MFNIWELRIERDCFQPILSQGFLDSLWPLCSIFYVDSMLYAFGSAIEQVETKAGADNSGTCCSGGSTLDRSSSGNPLYN